MSIHISPFENKIWLEIHTSIADTPSYIKVFDGNTLKFHEFDIIESNSNNSFLQAVERAFRKIKKTFLGHFTILVKNENLKNPHEIKGQRFLAKLIKNDKPSIQSKIKKLHQYPNLAV
jgi:hypothetical protein